MNESNNEGKIELAVRILGNELIAFRMVVDDFKMKWLIVGIAALVAIGWAASLFGPVLVNTFSG
jgi:hypothetical protein